MSITARPPHDPYPLNDALSCAVPQLPDGSANSNHKQDAFSNYLAMPSLLHRKTSLWDTYVHRETCHYFLLGAGLTISRVLVKGTRC